MAFQNALNSLDLTNVVASVQEELGLSSEDAQRAEELYRQYLTLCHKYPQMSVVPPKLADKVWHQHIMDTQKYAADCEQLFGQFIHHHPHKTDAEQGYETTKKLYKNEFGVDLEKYGISPELMRFADCGAGG